MSNHGLSDVERVLLAAAVTIAPLQVVQPQDVPRFAALGGVVDGQELQAQGERQKDELTISFLGGRWTATGW